MNDATITEALRAEAVRQRELATKACSPMAAQLHRVAARRFESAAVEVVFADHTARQAEQHERALRVTPDAPG